MKRGGYESISKQEIPTEKTSKVNPTLFWPKSFSWNGEDEFFKSILGSEEQSYYLDCFFKFYIAESFCFTWNWAAFFGTVFWFVYRKMWWYSIIYFCLSSAFLVLVVLTGISFKWYFFTIFFVPGLAANYLYYKWCSRKIEKIKLVYFDFESQRIMLSRLGGTSNIVFPILIVLFCIFLFSFFSFFRLYK